MLFLILTSIMCNSDSEWFKCFVKGNLWLLCSLDVMPILAVQRSVHHLLLLFVSNVCAGFKSCSSYNLPTQVKDVFLKVLFGFCTPFIVWAISLIALSPVFSASHLWRYFVQCKSLVGPSLWGRFKKAHVNNGALSCSHFDRGFFHRYCLYNRTTCLTGPIN